VDETAREEFRAYVAARSGALLGTATLLTGDRALAEDLVQTALARTCLAWGRIRQREAVDAYCRRVLVTTYATWWRRRWRGEVPTAEPPERAGADPYERVDETLRLPWPCRWCSPAAAVPGTGWDRLVREVGPVDAPGQLRVIGGNRLLAAVDASEPAFGGDPPVIVPAVRPVPVPVGTRELQRLTNQGRLTVAAPVTAQATAATLVARCRGSVPLGAADGRSKLGQVPCDGEVHVLAERVALQPGQALTLVGVPQLRGGSVVPVPYEVLIVTAG